MTCADLEILLCDYVDGTLDDEAKAAVEKHLADCASCAEIAADAAAAVAFIERIPAVEPPDELVTRLLFQVPRKHSESKRGGIRSLLTRWMEPILQPRFAMGMAMTILSFSLLGKFSGIPDRPLTPDDLRPSKIWQAFDQRIDDTWDKIIKYYENLRLVYEIESRLSEWTEEEQPNEPSSEFIQPENEALPVLPSETMGPPDIGERSVQQ